MISKFVLDARTYNNPYEASKKTVDWESSWIRSWLNDDFMEKAFDSFEQGHIDQILVEGEVNSDKKTSPGKDTSDRVFLINQEELQQYFPTNESMICDSTDYALMEDVANRTNDPGCFWALRTYNSGRRNLPVVWPGGGWDVGFDDSFRAGIRPSIWVDTSPR